MRLAELRTKGWRTKAMCENELPRGRSLRMPMEGRVTYMKLKGDQQLHLAEMARQECGMSTPECEGLAAEALESYLAAKQEASAQTGTMVNAGSSSSNSNNDRSSNDARSDSNHGGRGSGAALPEVHPMQVELALRISSVLLHLLDRPVEAWEAGYPTYLTAAEQPARLGARGLAITQALRDHLASIDVREADGGYQEECGTTKSLSCSHGQGAGGMPVRGESTEGEWGFLRMATGLNEAFDDVTQLRPSSSERLRALAQVKQARACMEGVRPTKRVLLGTMKHADVVRSATHGIFAVYAKRHTESLQQLNDDVSGNADKHTWLHGRKTAPQVCLRQGPPLSWGGFEAICRDFNIAPVVTQTDSSASRHLHPLASGRHNQRQTSKNHQSRDGLQNHQRSPRTNPSPATTTTPRHDSSPRLLFSQTRGSGLLSGMQARIAFVSAYTHGSVVASFPDHGDGSGHHGGGGRGSNDGGGDSSVPDNAGTTGRGEMGSGSRDAAYWRDMERVVLAGRTPDDEDPAPGLNFGQFVDAIARCGLIGFSVGIGSGIGDHRRPVSTAERIQAVFVETMMLLDREHVGANLHRQEDGAAAGGEGEGEALARGGKHPNQNGTAIGTKKGHRGLCNTISRQPSRKKTPVNRHRRREKSKDGVEVSTAGSLADPKPVTTTAP
ncbi:unnamed protein product, partial [Hapterophycus canaliculatus]